jgi:MAF protein
MRLILASESTRRQALLRRCGIAYTAALAQVEETARGGESPEDTAIRLSREKARAAAGRLNGESAWILAADTVVADGVETLGKPADVVQAREFLLRLGGRDHRVITGVCLLRAPAGEERTDLAVTRVRMRNYGADELEAYLATGDGLDKAGAYGIQHPAFRPAESIDGCYANVVGLPVCRVYALLAAAGIPPRRPLPEGCRSGERCAFADWNESLRRKPREMMR